MKAAKDLFSRQSTSYFRYRPRYPKELFDHLMRFVKANRRALDCGTGNGQVARTLADHFEHVDASDISRSQIELAPKLPNITYQCLRAEELDLERESLDLVTAAQAIHWFDHPSFFKMCEKILKPSAVLAYWGYGLIRTDETIDDSIDHFYQNVIGPYWSPERLHIDRAYSDIRPETGALKLVSTRSFEYRAVWSFEHLKGYLRSWSAYQSYMEEHEEDPVKKLFRKANFSTVQGSDFAVRFPIFSQAYMKD